jgi:pimeloyl-ACP methyl ester carboxylesterase
MKIVGIWFVVLVLTVLALPALAQTQFRTPDFKGFVQVRPDRELYVEYFRPQQGKPTVLLLNGLTFTTREFQFYAGALARRGIGVISFDFDGMGKSLLRYAPSLAVYSVDQQVQDVRTLLFAMKQRPPFNLAGLSYGGGIALGFSLAYPKEVNKLILMAPFTEALSSQDAWIRTQVRLTRQSFPNNPASDEELFDFFLRQFVYSTYPQSEPIVLENPFKLEGIFNLIRGIRKFRPVDMAHRLPPRTLHLMVAGSDQYVSSSLLREFWGRANPAARMSRILIHQSEHKIPQFVPEFAAAWTWQILKGNPVLSGGRDFEAWPFLMSVRSGQQRIPIED